MRLAEDRRARVPFALVGVVLLVGSAGLSATLAGHPVSETDQSVGTAMDRATAATNTALRGAVADAGRQAAREPVVEPADTPIGRVLNESAPYRDYLRIRVYLAVRAALDDVTVRANGVRGSVSLPPTPNASALRATKRRVEIAPAGDAESAGLRVRVDNVTVTAERDGRIVEREAVSPELVVATPALALHERVERFESRLNGGPLAPGLGRRLTARLYAVGWARGYAQRGGAPVENVLANRHVELAANGALLREQRAAFGRADPAGRGALALATARTGLTDLLAGTHNQQGSRATELLQAGADRYRDENPLPGGPVDDAPARSDTRRVAVNRTADRAFAAFVAERNDTGFDATLRDAYEADVRLVTAVRKTRSDPRPSLDSPGESWTLSDRRTESTVRVEPGDGPRPGTSGGRHLLAHETRRVVRAHVRVAEWTRGNETRTTTRRWTEAFAVGAGVAGDHAAAVAPGRPIRGAHEREGALDGPNLRDVAGAATERLVGARGDFDAVARRAVAGTLDTRPRTVAGRRPDGLRDWVYRDLVALRDRVRNVSVAASRTATLTDEEPPAARLAAELRSQRAELLDAPARYDGAADRARVAARAAYLDRVIARLDARAARTRETRAGLDEALGDAGVSLDRVRRVLAARARPAAPSPEPMAAAGPGTAANLSVAGAPPYLTLAELDHDQVAAIPDGEGRYPLAARNLNVFSVPYGDAADTVVSVFDGDAGGDEAGANVRTAALALRAANRTLARRANATLEARRDRLQSELSASLADVRRRLAGELSMPRRDLSARERRRAVRAGLARWNATHTRTLAVANGSAADAVAAELLAERPSLRDDWARLRADLALEAARQRVDGAPQSVVNRTGATARELAQKAAADALADAGERAADRVRDRWFGEVLSSVPAGLPVAPVPGYWYATVNVWKVSVRGTYERFAVRAPRASPGVSGRSVEYVRRNATVELDTDADGDPERVGRTTRVSFETDTVVAVVVPPGPPGVGDTDGDSDERSPGWSSGK